MRQAVHGEYRDQADVHWWFRARRRIFEVFLQAHLPAEPPAAARQVVELGPGWGVNVPLLERLGSLTVVDASRPSLESCRERGARLAVQGDGAAPPLAPGSVDLLCALDVLEHLRDDAGALRAWNDALADDGRLLLTVPALPLLWGRQDVLAEHERRYTRAQLRRRLSEAGLEVLRLSYFNTLFFLPILAVRLAMRPFLGRTSRGERSDLSMTMPFGLDELAYRIFASEARWLVRRDLPMGVSLLCLARRARPS